MRNLTSPRRRERQCESLLSRNALEAVLFILLEMITKSRAGRPKGGVPVRASVCAPDTCPALHASDAPRVTQKLTSPRALCSQVRSRVRPRQSPKIFLRLRNVWTNSDEGQSGEGWCRSRPRRVLLKLNILFIVDDKERSSPWAMSARRRSVRHLLHPLARVDGTVSLGRSAPRMSGP